MHKTPVLPEGFKLRVIHLHPNNSTKKQRDNSPYRTIARIHDANDCVVAEASAKCNGLLEFPSRKRGYDVAVGRVTKLFNSL